MARFINPFRVKPAKDLKNSLEEFDSFEGWQPKSDDPESGEEEAGKVAPIEVEAVCEALLRKIRESRNS